MDRLAAKGIDARGERLETPVSTLDIQAALSHLTNVPHELDNRAQDEPEKLAELMADLGAICDPECENARAHTYEQAQLAQLAARQSKSRV